MCKCLKICIISLLLYYLHASHLVRTRTTMEISNIPIAFCVILGNLIICYIIITVLHVFILLNKIKSNQINKCIVYYFSEFVSAKIFQ